MNSINITDLKTVRLSQDGRAVVILDQTRLPGSEVYVSLSSAEEVWEAIYKLKVRGAPAIGIAAAYGIYVCSRQIAANTYGGFTVSSFELRIIWPLPARQRLTWSLL